MDAPNGLDAETTFLAGGGELGSLMRAHDWSSTPLGPPKDWPRSLKTVVRIMLTSSQPIWIGWGEQLLYLYNDPYKSIIGGKHPHALGQPTSVVWREIWTEIQPLLDSAMNGDGTFAESQLLIMERNGYREETYYTFSYSPIPGDDGRPAGIICANSDETRRVISERQMGLLRDLAAGSADAKTVPAAVESCMAAVRTNDRDITFALACLRTHGQAGLAPVLDSADQAHVLAAIDPCGAPWLAEDVIRSGTPRIVELPPLPDGMAWPGGSWDTPAHHAMVLPIAPSGDAGQEGVLIVGLNPFRLVDAAYQDFLVLVAKQVSSAIANAQAYERERQRAEELAELDRAKTEFFSNVSHEFRTPLTLMLGPLADALGMPELPADLRSRLSMVERNALRLTKLVNTLLEFSRIEAGRHESVFLRTDLTQATADLASLFRSAIERAGLEFFVDCRPLPAPVLVDRDQWERVVLNLLSNALKFTLHGRITVRLLAEGDDAVLQVEDTGVGVPRDEVGRLFERFHRVRGTQGRTHEGSGIGLALVKELVRLHGGTVEAHSRLGEGSTFTVRLPLDSHRHDAPAAPAPAPAGKPQAAAYVQEALRWLPGDGDTSAQHGEVGADTVLLGDRYRSTWGSRVLVADDNADMRQYLERLLSPYFQVETAADGREALDAVRRRRPALLLSDVMMPRLDGFGLLNALRSDTQLRSLPVILLSARAGEEARVEGLRAGADDYLVKPFSSRELLVRVAAAIELDRARRIGEEQLKLFLAGASMFTWDIDLATERATLSDNAPAVLGARPQDLAQGMSAIHPKDATRHRQLLDETIRNKGQFADEVRFVRADNGEVRWMEIRGRVLCDEAGTPIRLTGLSFDVTERKGMEQALRDLDRRKDEFLAMLAHELRNPMAPIRNAVELMQRLNPPDDRVRRAIGIVDRQVHQLNRMVDDLLDVSRITRGRIQLEREPVDLEAVVSAAVEAMEPVIRERGHRLTVRAGMPMHVIGDAARLQQCLVNLLTNAAKYTDAGGQIDIEMLRDGDQGLIRVSDTGAGIPSDLLPHVFDLFVQSDRTLDRAQGGLGIGLSVVRSLVEMHGGQVSASSPGTGMGSVFEVMLPLSDALESDRMQEPSAWASPRKVLIVDDNRDAAESLGLVLEAEGHEVRTAANGEQALRIALEWMPDLVLLDIGLPGMDGYEVARRLRAMDELRGCRIVALTGYGQPSDRHRAEAAGFDDHLVKPAPMDAISRMLGRTFSQGVAEPLASPARMGVTPL
ncbi:ATP-binding protein [Piscinibacter terrae]|uniref:histidine kinase n=1 Tax=Piscinibacter terrae TaxID=2496871 RepID=A0A3N7HK92_9BURK|nr:ATP-binding protein [Albitalea terrae]RQP21953.1 response regulator [Albitalea terrae]